MSNRGKARGSNTNSVPPDKELLNEIGEIKDSLEYMSEKVDLITEIKSDLSKALQVIEKLQHENQKKEKRILFLEDKLEELEQYSKIDNVIISGLNYKYKTYAGAARGNSAEIDANENTEEQESLETQVVSFLQESLGIDVLPSDISACHTLGGKEQRRTLSSE